MAPKTLPSFNKTLTINPTITSLLIFLPSATNLRLDLPINHKKTTTVIHVTNPATPITATATATPTAAKTIKPPTTTTLALLFWCTEPNRMEPKVHPKSSRTRGHCFGELQDGSFVLSSFWLVLYSTAISTDEELDSFLILWGGVVLIISCIIWGGVHEPPGRG